MKRLEITLMIRLYFATAALLTGWLAGSVLAQTSTQATVPRQGVVTDWSSDHVIFSDPGTLEDARRNGKEEQWRRVANDPRYRMQLMRRRRLPMSREGTVPGSNPARPPVGRISVSNPNPVHVDWQVPLIPAGGSASSSGSIVPAKYAFSNPETITEQDCTDYVIFPIYQSSSSTQANLLGVEDLYGNCGGPTVRFAYAVAGFPTAVVSLDGKKVAFPTRSTTFPFHVLTLGTDGDLGCPPADASPQDPCNGDNFAEPAVPGTNNNAVDVTVQLPASNNDYFTNQGQPFVYACGGNDTGTLPALRRIGFDSTDVMNSAADSEFFTLNTVAGISCSNLLDSFTTSDQIDRLFLAVSPPIGVSGGTNSLMSFDITGAFPSAQEATQPWMLVSQMIIDNVSTGGGSNLYFETQGVPPAAPGSGNQQNGVQISQAALQ